MNRKVVSVLLTTLAFTFSSTSVSQAWFVSSKKDDFGSNYVTINTYYVSDLGQFDDLQELADRDDEILISLTIRCRDRVLEVYSGYLHTVSDDTVLDDSQSKVQVKFNNGKVKNWPVSSTPSAVFYENTKVFLKTLLASKSFAVRAQGDTGLGVAANFKLSGLSGYKSTLKSAGCSV
jgi:hypothetical protein